MNRGRLRVCICVIVLALFPVYASGVEEDDTSDAALDVKMGLFLELRGLMDNPMIQSELEISDEQLKKAGEILAQFEKDQRNFISLIPTWLPEITSAHEARPKPSPERLEFVNIAYDSLKDVLLPHQIKRIRQIARQADILRHPNKGFVGILSAPVKLKDLVGLTDKECDELQPRLQKLESEYAKKFAKLRAEAYKEVLDELDEGQREKMDTLIGPLFDFEESKRSFHRARIEKLMENYKGAVDNKESPNTK